MPKKKFTIEKLADDITKITEEIQVNESLQKMSLENKEKSRDKGKKRTIRFDNKKVTYQYPKEKEQLPISPNFEPNVQADDVVESTFSFNFGDDDHNEVNENQENNEHHGS